MTYDRDLMETIKTHFARRSSAQLQEIARANNQERWSAEAIAAAGEVLQDRLAGRAQEPEVPEEEPPPPPASLDPFSLALVVGLGSVGGIANAAVRALVNRGAWLRGGDRSNADLPVPFGPKIAWLALDTTETDSVASALDLREAHAATWAEGIEAAHQLSVFVTPPLADWTLAVATALFPPERAEPFVKPLLERLSRQFGEAQYFATHRDVELHIWARARQGRLVRGYGWLGEKGLTLWDEGGQTREERTLGLGSVGSPCPAAKEVHKTNVTGPDEAGVMQLASLWSIDPTALDEEFKEPVMGLVGHAAWVPSRAIRGRK
jgi:hypothetical protein